VTPLAADFLPGLPAAFRYGMEFIWDPSRDGHDQDSAPGETFLTRWGVTQATWDGAVHDGVASGTLEAATQASLGNVFLARYFQAMSLGLFPTAIGFCLFCDATLTGPGHTSLLLQGIVATTEDGVIGPRTLAATAEYLSLHGQATLVDAIVDGQLEYLATLANAPQFLRGWTARELAEQIRAHEIIAAEPDTVTVVAAVGAPVMVATPLPVAAVPMIAPAVLGVGRWLVTVERA